MVSSTQVRFLGGHACNDEQHTERMDVMLFYLLFMSAYFAGLISLIVWDPSHLATEATK